MTVKPVTAALQLLETLAKEQRGPTHEEYHTLKTALIAADARTRLDPSKHKKRKS